MYTAYDNLCFTGHAHMQAWKQGSYNWAAYSEYHRKTDHEIYIPVSILNLVIQGQKRMYDGQRIHHLHAGDVFLIPAGTLLCSEILGRKEGYASINLLLPDEWLLPLPLSETAVATCRLQPGPHWEHFSAELFSAFSKRSSLSPDYVMQKALQLIPAEGLQMLRQSLSSRLPVQTIGKELAAPLQIEDLARQSHMSKATLKRHFQQRYLKSPMHWVWEKRLERTSFLLRTTTLSIQEIAYSNGFENIPHFYRLFRRTFGMTPKEWRAVK
ncbi:helix-turn-helix domain-containing protein [Chitinophaga sp.]|uniref:helix-turn-helix transcriptional regulator n=1 Tax=Chitinophaga sp. TaxID=1869181 RepID=UPI0031E0E186